MARALLLLFVPVLASAGTGQEGTFESPEFGVRLKIPAKWTVGSSTPPEILKIALQSEPFKGEIVLHNLAFVEEHITLAQYREQFRQYIQRNYRDPRILDDRDLVVGGRKAIVFTTASKAKNDSPAVSFKGLVELSPMRMLSIECIVPKAMEEEAAKTYEALLASIEFFPRKTTEQMPDQVKKFAETAAKLPATEATFERKSELEYVQGEERTFGSYTIEMRAATREGVAGLEVTTSDIIDLGADGGRLEKRTKGFLSDDLSKQRADVEIIHRSKEQRTQYFTASVALNGTEMTADRRINGEKVAAKVTVPENCVLMELLETVEFRLLAAGKTPLLGVPVVPAFDNEAGYVKMENRGEYEMKSPAGGGLAKVTEFVVGREDGAVITYWYDPDRKPIRRAVGGQSVILRAKK